MGRRSKGKKRASIEKNSESVETSEINIEEINVEIKISLSQRESETADVAAASEETESPVKIRSRLPVPCALGLGHRHSAVKPKMAFQRPAVEESPDCKRSLIPRLLPVRSPSNHSPVLETDNCDVKRIAQEA
ncbi:hypothetical protein RB195_021340 [Necator americanus]|uniref:Uncharacterized protein n=1 Tax=Necator americanus TaxID=51031 RepID=A0ABR1EAW5_NECAM